MNTLRSAIQGRDITPEKVLNQKTLEGNTVTGECKVFLVCNEGRKLRDLMSTKKIANLKTIIQSLTQKLNSINTSSDALDKKNLATITTCESELKTFDAYTVESVKQYKNKDKELVVADPNINCFVSTKNKDGSFSQIPGSITGVVMSDAKIVIEYAGKKNIFVDMKYVCIGDKDVKSDSRDCELLQPVSVSASVPVVAPSAPVTRSLVPTVLVTASPVPTVPVTTLSASPVVPALRGGAVSNKRHPDNKTTSDYSHCE
jgi:hypothetical protein